MKVEFVVSKPIPTAAQLRKRRVYTVCCWILRGLLVLTTILFTWITCWGCGLGWISRARAGSNWPIEFAGYGQMLLVGSGLLTLGTVLVLLCRKNWLNWAAAGSATAGVTLAMLALYRVTAYASEHSFYSRLTILVPAIGEEERIYNPSTARISDSFTSVWREWGIQ